MVGIDQTLEDLQAPKQCLQANFGEIVGKLWTYLLIRTSETCPQSYVDKIHQNWPDS